MICAASLESFRPKLYEETEYSKDGEYETSIIFRLIHPRLFSLSLSLFFVIYSVFLQPYNTVCCKSFKLTSIHVTEFLNLHLGWDDQTKKCAEKNNVINLVYVSCIVQISVNIHRNTCSSANNSCFNFHFHFMPILKYLATLGSGASSLSFFLSLRSEKTIIFSLKLTITRHQYSNDTRRRNVHIYDGDYKSRIYSIIIECSKVHGECRRVCVKITDSK